MSSNRSSFKIDTTNLLFHVRIDLDVIIAYSKTNSAYPLKREWRQFDVIKFHQNEDISALVSLFHDVTLNNCQWTCCQFDDDDENAGPYVYIISMSCLILMSTISYMYILWQSKVRFIKDKLVPFMMTSSNGNIFRVLLAIRVTGPIYTSVSISVVSVKNKTIFWNNVALYYCATNIIYFITMFWITLLMRTYFFILWFYFTMHNVGIFF